MSYKIRSGSKKAKEMVLDESGYTYTSPEFKWKKCEFQSFVRTDGKTHGLHDQLLIQIPAQSRTEESFRVLKSNFEARPIFVCTEESIKGHFVNCYLALVIQRLLEYLLHTKGIDYSTDRIQDAIRSATITKVHLDGKEIFIKNKSDDVFSDI